MVAATLLIISCVSLVTLVVGIAIQYQCSTNQERHLRDIVRLHRQNAVRNLMEGLSDEEDGSGGECEEPGVLRPEGIPIYSGWRNNRSGEMSPGAPIR
jgi:hypothetical protein